MNDDERIKNIQFKHKENKEYFDPRYGYLNLSSTGIHKVEMICKKDVVSLSSNIFEHGLSGTA